jgi:glycosyltransferase involved in cell wall biosynthesis
MVAAPSLDILGGQSIQAEQLRRCLGDESAIDVSSIATNPRLPGPLRRLQSIKYLRTVVTSAVYISELLVRVWRCDVVHVFAAPYSSFAISATPPILIAKAARKRVVLHYHGGELDLHLRRWRRTAAPTMRRVDAIVAPSEYLREQFARHGFAAHVIPNVIDPDRWDFHSREPLRPVFLSNRRLAPECNVACVLRGFAAIQSTVAGARLIVAADGSERRELESLAQRLGLSGTEFVGWVAPEHSAELYSSADVFLNASDDRDNVPLSILEAFASGLPVISTSAGGISELVHGGETGMLVPAEDHEQLAASALALLSDPELALTLARNARRACSQFTWAAVRNRWVALYEELAPASTDRDR